MLAFPDVQLLDVTGPLEVFCQTAQLLSASDTSSRSGYAVEIAALAPGPVTTSSGVVLVADREFSLVRGEIDTLLVAGGRGVHAVLSHRPLIAWLKATSAVVRRLGSVCTGAFLLAQAGLLDGRSATTHWEYCSRLAEKYPHVRVAPDPIFVQDGNVFTSAGVTAGMDLALAMVEADHGRAIALEVARELVLFLRRPGGQSQFSAQLSVQLAEREPLRELQAFILEHPSADLSIPALAQRVAMSTRNFARLFVLEVGMTPGRYVEAARLEAARRQLEDTQGSIEVVARAAGFGSPECMRRAFLRALRVSPRAYRERFKRAPAAPARP